MSGPQFFETGMGQEFYQVTLPALIRAINRLAAAIEAQEDRKKKERQHTSDNEKEEP